MEAGSREMSKASVPADTRMMAIVHGALQRDLLRAREVARVGEVERGAVRIVQLAAPFAAFPPDIRRDTDILYITRTWTFAPGDALISQ